MGVNYKELGARIRIYRKKIGMTQEVLAEMSEVEPSSISNIERGTTKVSLSTLTKIANALYVTMDALLCDSIINFPPISNKEVEEILADCTSSEKRSLIKILKSIKTILRYEFS